MVCIRELSFKMKFNWNGISLTLIESESQLFDKALLLVVGAAVSSREGAFGIVLWNVGHFIHPLTLQLSSFTKG